MCMCVHQNICTKQFKTSNRLFVQYFKCSLHAQLIVASGQSQCRREKMETLDVSDNGRPAKKHGYANGHQTRQSPKNQDMAGIQQKNNFCNFKKKIYVKLY